MPGATEPRDLVYETALRREILLSERLRMRAIAVVLAVVFVLVVAVFALMPAITQRLLPGATIAMPLTIFLPFIAYELLALAIIGRFIARDRELPIVGRYANALIETSLPTVIILVQSRHTDPDVAFGFWPPLLYFVFIILSTLRLDFRLSAWTGIVAAVGYMAVAFTELPLAFDAANPMHVVNYHFSRSLMLLGGGIVAGLVAGRLRRQFEASIAAGAARDRVTNLFGQHVSPAVVEKLLAAHSDPPSETRPVCVMFVDIRGFTALARSQSAAATVDMLNEFFVTMVAIVDRHGGIVNKFLGDGFLALFGAPLADRDAAAHAVAAAREMVEAVAARNAVASGPALRVGIGLHAGDAVTGTVGSPQRKEYTVIGDTVNRAARLEQMTKFIDAQVLASDEMRREAGAVFGPAQDLGPVEIRGYAEPVRVWKLA